MENKDKPAFSVALVNNGSANHSEVKGLTKLEYFTAMAMQGLISNPWLIKERQGEKYLMQSETLTRLAIERAKETLKQLEEK